MTDAIVSSEAVAVATTVDDPTVRVANENVDVLLTGDAAATLSLIAMSVATTVAEPTIRVSDISVCVLRNPRTRHSFRVVWVE